MQKALYSLVFSFLTCSLFSYSYPVLAQPLKRSFSISPQILVNEWKFKTTPDINSQFYIAGTSLHYYVWNKLAIGFCLVGSYAFIEVKAPFSYSTWRYRALISPEIRYNLITTRLSPFVGVRLGEFGYSHQRTTYPYTIPNPQKSTGNLIINYPLYRSATSIGLSYSLKNKFALTGQINLYPFEPDYFSNSTIGIGCQFLINGESN